MDFTFKCTSVQTIAFDDQRVTLEHEDITVIIQLKSHKLFGSFVEGQEYDEMMVREQAESPSNELITRTMDSLEDERDNANVRATEVTEMLNLARARIIELEESWQKSAQKELELTDQVKELEQKLIAWSVGPGPQPAVPESANKVTL